MRIILARHGRTPWNEEKRLQGWKGESLSEKGLEEAKVLAEKLSFAKPEVLYSSDLARAIQTAEILIRTNSWNVQHITDVRLREINHGLWEGLRVSEISELRQMHTVEGFRPPGGESFRDIAVRIERFLKDLKQTGYSQVVIVGHQVSNAVLFLLVNGFPPEHRVFGLLSAGMVSSLGLLANTGRNLLSLVQANSEWEEVNYL